MVAGRNAAAEAGPSAPTPALAWGVTFLLFLASIVSVIDRTVLNVVVDAVKLDLHISDVQISLLQGLAFGLFYATIGIWLGFAADRLPRRNLIIAGIALWSCATIGGGIARSFGELFASRMLVGLGEAALAPAAISLIADLFPLGQRGRPIGFFLMGQAVANGVAISLAGSLLAAAAHGAFALVPVLSALKPWRVVFVLCGMTGLFVSAAFFLTREPPRGAGFETTPFGRQIRSAGTYLVRERRRFAGVYLGFALCFLGAYGAGAWQVVMISRKFGVTPSVVSSSLGPLTITFGLLGPFVGGFLVDRTVRKAGLLGLLRLLALAPLLALPSTLAVMAPTPFVAALLCSTQVGVTATVGTAVLSYLQSAVPSQMRGAAVSLTGLVNTLIGATLGPMLVALLTERVFANPVMVGWAILFIAAPAQLAAAGCFAWSAIRLQNGSATSSPFTSAPKASHG